VKERLERTVCPFGFPAGSRTDQIESSSEEQKRRKERRLRQTLTRNGVHEEEEGSEVSDLL